MATSLSEQTKDLSSCSVCYDTFNEKKLKPKYLSCLHTFCLKCTKKMADLPPPGQVTCPLCDKVCKVPAEGSDSFPNNLHALHIVDLKKALTERENTIKLLSNTNSTLSSTNMKLNNVLKNGQLWCVTCKGLTEPTCHEQKHKMTNFGKDVEEFNDWLVEWEADTHQGIGKVGQGQEHLEKEKEQLMAKVKAIEVKIEEGEGLLKKLRKILANGEKMKQLPAESKATVFMRKNLRQAIADTKQEVKKAEEFAKRACAIPEEEKAAKEDEVSVEVKSEEKERPSSVSPNSANVASTSENNTKEAAELDQQSSSSVSSRRVSLFKKNCLAAGRQQSKFFNCRILSGHTGVIPALDFSDDGSFIVSGSSDQTVRLWTVKENLYTAQPMSTQHDSMVLCVAISSDNNLVFSGGSDSLVLIHDARTGTLLNYVEHPESVGNITLKPGSTNGKVFASSCSDGVLRLFDIRSSVNVSVFESSATDDENKFWSASFSPVDSMIIAAACKIGGIKLFDIRQNSFRCVHRLHSKFSTSSNCVFNRQGTRILGGRVYDPFMMVFDVPTVSGGGDDASKMYHLSTQGYSVSGVGRNKFCFAGKDDELVVSSSADNNLYVWSLPENQERAYQTVNSSLHVLRDGHKDAIYSVRYDHCSDTLASAGAEKTIKLWTPVAQQ